MQSFTLPSSILQDFDKTNTNFFCNKDPGCGAANLVGWDSICCPKCVGGLSFQKAKITNLAFECKLVWKIIAAPENIWVLFIGFLLIKPYTPIYCRMSRLVVLQPFMLAGIRFWLCDKLWFRMTWALGQNKPNYHAKMKYLYHYLPATANLFWKRVSGA